jgi:hypothetical protein
MIKKNKNTPKLPSTKKGKYDMTVKTDLSPDELLKLAIILQ